MKHISKKRLEKLIELNLEICRAMSKIEESLEKRCSSVLNTLSNFVEYKQAGIFLLDEDTNEIRALTTENYDEETKELVYPIGKGFIGKAVETGRTYYTPDLHNEKNRRSKNKPLFTDKGSYKQVNSALVIPIKTKEKRIGVLEITCERKDAFTKKDIEALKIMAYNIAPWIEITKMIKNRHLDFGKDIYSHLEQKHPYLRGHAKRVTKISCSLARELGLEEIFIKKLKLGAEWHDIGKVRIRDDILDSKKAYTQEENPVKIHSEEGYRFMLKYGANPVQDKILLNIIRFHHEHYDGSGYPLGLEGQKIPLEARIVFVADVYDALTSRRPYRKARGEPEKYKPKEAVTIMFNMRKQFDPYLLEVFMNKVFPRIRNKKKKV